VPRSFLPLVFGVGLDRASGVTVVPPQAMREAENVHLWQGKAEVRGGLVATTDLGGDYVGLVQSSRVRNEGVHVLVSGTVASLVRTAGDGTDPLDLGVWQDPISSAGRLRAIGTESGGKVFVAHEERAPNLRGPTVYYDPATDPTTFSELSSDWAAGDLDPSVEENKLVRFRGVATHLDYLVGWGFGTNDADSPDMLRISDPGDPLTFQPNAWIRAGQPGDPIVACVSIPAGILVFKEAETFIVTGTDSSNFGVHLIDHLFGLAGSKLAVVVGDTVYFWGLHGPRVGSGGPSVDLSWDLGLSWPSPEDVASSERLVSGFGAYLPDRQQVLFVFGDWVYALSLRDQLWAHWRMGAAAASGGIMYAESGAGVDGYPSFVASSAPNTPNSIFVHYRNNLSRGDEEVELWFRPHGEVSWTLHGSQPVATSPERFEVTGRSPGTSHEVALRYTRDAAPLPGYTGAPSSWPSVSRGVRGTLSALPASATASWARTSAMTEQITLLWADEVRTKRVWRKLASQPDSSYVLLQDGISAETLSYADTTVAGEVRYTYRVDFVESGATTPAVVIRWSGPDAPTGLASVGVVPDWFRYGIGFHAGPPGFAAEIWDDFPDPGVFALRGSLAAGVVYAEFALASDGRYWPDSDWYFLARARHRVTTFGVEDISDFSDDAYVRVTVSSGTPELIP
jgi:hypothetical protein